MGVITLFASIFKRIINCSTLCGELNVKLESPALFNNYGHSNLITVQNMYEAKIVC